MQTLYPAIKPYAIHQLGVDDLHTLYIEESGSPEGIPVLFLHGGPGAGADPKNRQFFNPLLYRIILFDQRGAGRSTPHAELKKNTTQDLIEDIEAIRLHLGIERWVLCGGSWGSTLALLYAEAYPDKVLNMVLRGIFLCRSQDLSWFYQDGGASRIFPDAWENFVSHLPPKERHHIIASYYRRLTGKDELAQMAAAKAWAEWEGTCSTLQPNSDVVNFFTDPHVAISLSRIETHYFMNESFLEPDQIIQNAKRLQDIPGVIIHGRYDIVCPLDNAFALHQVWPNSELMIIRDAGHSNFETGIIVAMVSTLETIAKQLKGQ
jgi:proline iminopeptidase